MVPAPWEGARRLVRRKDRGDNRAGFESWVCISVAKVTSNQHLSYPKCKMGLKLASSQGSCEDQPSFPYSLRHTVSAQ